MRVPFDIHARYFYNKVALLDAAQLRMNTKEAQFAIVNDWSRGILTSASELISTWAIITGASPRT